jgi:hypothetical protein
MIAHENTWGNLVPFLLLTAALGYRGYIETRPVRELNRK